MPYEYHVAYVGVDKTAPEEFSKTLNEYGRGGWEIINVLFLGRRVNYPYQLIMKRPLPEEPIA